MVVHKNQDQLVHGLSTQVALAQFSKFGPNAMPDSERQSLLRSMVNLLGEPMVLLLLACTTIYLFLGDLAEGAFLGASIGFLIVISILQKRKSERALEALRTLSSPRALVLRDEKKIRIPSAEVVPGDVLVLQEGDRIAADAIVLSATHLHVDESLLTGESAPVRKRPARGGEACDKIDGNQKVFGSTLVVKGQGLAKVTFTGSSTEVGRIGKTIRPPSSEPTHLQIEIRRLVRILATIGIVFCWLITLIYALTRNDWSKGILAGLSTAMSLLPEEFPVILTIFLAMGAWRLSKIKVLTRNLAAIENLGAITALCVDKTGTLTLNKMNLRELRLDNALFDLTANKDNPIPDYFHELLEYGVLASHQNPFDPMERAIQNTLNLKLSGTDHVHRNWQLVQEYPLSDDLLAMSCVWKSNDDSAFVVAAKGAPEAIVALCDLPRTRALQILKQTEAMAAQGLRVLGVAKALFNSPNLPKEQNEFDFGFVGLLGLEDPLRPDAREAVAKCRSAGIRVIMITGDYPLTAQKIAKEAGLEFKHGVLTGSDLQSMNDLTMRERLKTINVFARTLPEQKLRIVF